MPPARGDLRSGNVLHGVESSGWCANEGRYAGDMAARFLRGEIDGNQAGARIELSPDLDFIVPQLWVARAACRSISADGGCRRPQARHYGGRNNPLVR
jgi:hypothetical protein